MRSQAARCRPGARRGFTLLEILVGVSILALAAASLMTYASSQRKSLNRANQLADATRAASTALEVLKGQLADSVAFRSSYDDVERQPATRSHLREVNNRKYSVTVTLSRAPAPLYALKARALTTWEGVHEVELGLLIPGPSDLL